MHSVTVSSKYQIVIPSAIRKAMNIRPGEKLQLIQTGSSIELVRTPKIGELRGFLKGMDTTIIREEDRI
jgi:AbrB family looped-hinge helix DNA binding protein